MRRVLRHWQLAVAVLSAGAAAIPPHGFLSGLDAALAWFNLIQWAEARLGVRGGP